MKANHWIGHRRTSAASEEDKKPNEIVEANLHRYPIVLPPEPIEGVTFGLELLANAKHIFVRPAQELLDEGKSSEEHGQYEIIDSASGRIYYAWETDVHGEGRNRNYVLKIVDYDARPVFQVRRISGCLACCLEAFNCFGTSGSLVEIENPDGERIGALRQRYNGWRPKFTVLNAFEKPSMTVLGPSGGDCCYGCNLVDASFDVLDMKGKRVGSIHSGSGNPMSEQQRETFGIHFFANFSVEDKAILVGTVFALNFVFFEHRQKEPHKATHVLDDMEKSRKETHQRDLEELGMESTKSSETTMDETISKNGTSSQEPVSQSAGDRRATIMDDAHLHLVNTKKFTLDEKIA